MTNHREGDTGLSLGQRLSRATASLECIQGEPGTALEHSPSENNVMMLSNFKRLSAEWQKLFVDSNTEAAPIPSSSYSNKFT